MKKLLLAILLICFSAYLAESYRNWYLSDSFRVIFFDVGQGDSSLIVTPDGKTILTDGGPDDKVLSGLGKVLPFWYRHIDLLVITHAHDDHITGLIEISRRYKIKQVLYNNLDFKTPALEALIKVFKESRLKLVLAQVNLSFNFTNGCSLNILSANKEKKSDENDYSIVSRFNCLGRSVLLTGDASEIIEKKLIRESSNLKADILKIPHHGSLSASSNDFLKAVNPLVAVISVGLANKFNHPAPTILDRLQKLPVDIYRTDQSSDIEFLANNNVIKLIK